MPSCWAASETVSKRRWPTTSCGADLLSSGVFRESVHGHKLRPSTCGGWFVVGSGACPAVGLLVARELVAAARVQPSGEGGDRLLFVGEWAGLVEVAVAGPPGNSRCGA